MICAGTQEGVHPVMNNILRVFLLIAMLTIAASFPAVANDLPSFPFLLVEGKAKAEVQPDKATLSVYVSAFDPESGVAVETVRRQLIALLGILAKHSIPDDAITSYNLAKEVERARKDRVEMEIVGYHVSRRLKVEFVDISNFAELVAEITKLDNVSSLDANFDVTNRDNIELKLVNEAGAHVRNGCRLPPVTIVPLDFDVIGHKLASRIVPDYCRMMFVSTITHRADNVSMLATNIRKRVRTMFDVKCT